MMALPQPGVDLQSSDRSWQKSAGAVKRFRPDSSCNVFERLLLIYTLNFWGVKGW